MTYLTTLRSLSVAFVLVLIQLGSWAQMMHNPSLGIAFSENQGQFPDQVLYSTNFAAGQIFVEKGGITFSLYDKEKAQEIHENRLNLSDHAIERTSYKMVLVNAQEPISTGLKQLDWHTNFYLGDDPSAWVSGASVFEELDLKEVYPGIDLEFLGEYNNFKYNVKVAPGADLGQMLWSYEGVKGLAIENGELQIETQVGIIHEMKPLAWQIDESGGRELVSCKYVIEGNTVHFECLNGYDSNRELIIDPVLVFSSYSGSTSDNWGFTATFDADDYAYGGGVVAGSGYPTTEGSVEEDFQGGTWDIGLIKFSQDGSALEYATYLGGSGTDFPSSLVVYNDKLWVLGFSDSGNFPTTEGVFAESNAGGYDIVVSKFSADGSVLEASTFVGGSANDGQNTALTNNYGDEYRSEIVADNQGNIYVMSNSSSSNIPFPSDSFQPDNNGGQDAVIFKFNNDLTLMDWGSYFGGSAADSGYGLAISDEGVVYAVGSTQSSDLAMMDEGNISSLPGNRDGYIIRVEDGEVTVGSFIGTPDYDQCFFVQLDTQDRPWVTGQSEGDMPVSAGVYANNGAGQYIHQYSEDLSEILLASTFGNGGGFWSPINICPTAFLIDNCNRIFVSGWGGALNGQFGDTNDMPITADAYQSVSDGSDFYVAVFDEFMSDIIFASYIGSLSINEHVDGGTSRFSPKGIIYQAVCAGCGGSDNFPTTDGAWSQQNGSSNCNMAVFKYDLEIHAVHAQAAISPSGVGCVPLTVEFTNAGSTGEDGNWNFGQSGWDSTDDEPTWVFDEEGIFEVSYIVSDPESCNIADTTSLFIVAGDSLNLNPDFINIGAPCPSDPTIDLTYTGSSEYDDLFWDMGDNNTETGENVTYTYDEEGMYTITLTVVDEFCEWQMSIEEEIDVEEANVEAIISADVTEGCAPLEVNFSSAGSVGVNGIWYLGNGESSQEVDVTTIYPNGNEWEAFFIIEDEDSPCADTAWINITTINPVVLNPAFALSSPPCTDSTFVTVNYVGSDYSTLVFDLGDGNTSSEENFDHTYDFPGVYEVTVTITDEGCSEPTSLTQEIEIDNTTGIVGEVRFPNVISPNNDNFNTLMRPFLIAPNGDKIILEKTDVSYAFDEFQLDIYNRWGELVFEGHTTEPFWDGQMGAEESGDGVFYYIARWSLLCGDTREYDAAGHFEVLRK